MCNNLYNPFKYLINSYKSIMSDISYKYSYKLKGKFNMSRQLLKINYKKSTPKNEGLRYKKCHIHNVW